MKPTDTGDHAQLRVRLDQLDLRADHRRDQRRLRHGVRLLEHHRREGQGEQQDVVQVRGHQQGDHDAHDRDQLDDQPTAAGHPVDRRADQRGDDRERGDADREEEQHLGRAPLPADVEEQRPGERDGHHRVAGGHQRMCPGEPLVRRQPWPSPADAGPVGTHDAVVHRAMLRAGARQGMSVGRAQSLSRMSAGTLASSALFARLFDRSPRCPVLEHGTGGDGDEHQDRASPDSRSPTGWRNSNQPQARINTGSIAHSSTDVDALDPRQAGEAQRVRQPRVEHAEAGDEHQRRRERAGSTGHGTPREDGERKDVRRDQPTSCPSSSQQS